MKFLHLVLYALGDVLHRLRDRYAHRFPPWLRFLFRCGCHSSRDDERVSQDGALLALIGRRLCPYLLRPPCPRDG
jgi:hypothetical protein